MTSNSGLVEAPETSEAAKSAGLPGVRLVRRRLRWVALAAVLGLALGGLLSLVRAPSYESTVFLSVTSPTVADASSVARSAQAIARIATSPSVVGDPLRDAGLIDQAAVPRRYVAVQAAPDAPLISVTGTSDEARTAQLTTQVVTGTLEDLGAFEDYAVTAIGTAPLPTEPRTPQWVGPVGGAAVTAGLALVLAATVPRAVGGTTTPTRGPTSRRSTERGPGRSARRRGLIDQAAAPGRHRPGHARRAVMSARDVGAQLTTEAVTAHWCSGAGVCRVLRRRGVGGLGDDGVGVLGPGERPAGVVPGGDEAFDGDDQVGDGRDIVAA